jgi:hypothetical protein
MRPSQRARLISKRQQTDALAHQGVSDRQQHRALSRRANGGNRSALDARDGPGGDRIRRCNDHRASQVHHQRAGSFHQISRLAPLSRPCAEPRIQAFVPEQLRFFVPLRSPNCTTAPAFDNLLLHFLILLADCSQL